MLIKQKSFQDRIQELFGLSRFVMLVISLGS